MRFWGREIFGWFLTLLGLLILIYAFLRLASYPPDIIEAGPWTLIGIIIFRGGIHLLKVAVAARICMKAPPLNAARPAEPTPPRQERQPLE
jgi:hypothetical protein